MLIKKLLLPEVMALNQCKFLINNSNVTYLDFRLNVTALKQAFVNKASPSIFGLKNTIKFLKVHKFATTTILTC